MMAEPEFVLYHRLADEQSAAARRWIVQRGLKAWVDFQNVDADAAGFAARGGRRVPALWDGSALHEGFAAIRRVLSSIIRSEEQP